MSATRHPLNRPFAGVHGVAVLATGDMLACVSVEEATDATVDVLLSAIAAPGPTA